MLDETGLCSPVGECRWTRVKEVLGDILLLVLGSWLLFHFVMFWLYGWVFVGESSKPWLAVETTMALLVIVLGFDRLIEHSGK